MSTVQSARVRRAARKVEKVQGSRPQKPDRDPLLESLLPLLRSDNRSNYAKAQVSGLSTATLKKWQDGETRRPQAVSLQMAYRMLGYRLVPVREN